MIARYHRKAPPTREHEDFSRLRRRERTLVERLGALLRVADALDHQHSGLVQSIEVTFDRETVEIQPTVEPGQSSRLTLERKALHDKGALFEQLFGRRITLSGS